MSVYWNSQVDGMLKLDGGWTEEAVKAFVAVEKAWELDGDYGLWSCDELSESLSAHFTALVGSHDDSTCFSREYGWNDFEEGLKLLNEWTYDWISFTQSSDEKVEHPLTLERYVSLLKIMYEKHLSISIKFYEITRMGREIFETQCAGTLTSDGKNLIYTTSSVEEKIQTWQEYSNTSLDSAVVFFMNFIEDADESKIRKWVENNIKPTNLFEDYQDGNMEAYIFEEEVEEEVLQDFINTFSPNTNVWNTFFQETKEELEWFTEDDSQM